MHHPLCVGHRSWLPLAPAWPWKSPMQALRHSSHVRHAWLPRSSAPTLLLLAFALALTTQATAPAAAAAAAAAAFDPLAGHLLPAWSASPHLRARDGSPFHRHLQQAGSCSSSSCNCSCDQPQPLDDIMQVVDVFGTLPIALHYTHSFQQKHTGALLRTSIQTFSSPSDLSSVAILQPNYALATLEQRKTFTGKGFQPPADLEEMAQGNVTLSDTMLGVSQNILLYQASDVLVQSKMVQLVYRRDVLANRSLGVPDTWEQMLEIAAQVNGSDLNGDGVGDYALCVDVDPACKMYWLFSAVAASMLQVNGTSSGYLMDPVTGQYLIHSEGMLAALRLWARLMRYNTPRQSTKTYCGMWEDAFAEGRCLFTLSLQQVNSHNRNMNAAASTNASKLYSWGRTGHAPTPGSTTVYDRGSGTMVPCTSTTCPLGTPLQGGAGRDRQQQRYSGGAQQQYVNRAPVMSRHGNYAQKLRSGSMTALSLQSYAQYWSLASSAWIFLSFDPMYLTPGNVATLAAYGLDMQGPSLSALNTSYYNSTQFIVDAYRWTSALRNQTAWTPNPLVSSSGGSSNSSGSSTPRPGSVPWMGVAATVGLEEQEAHDFIRVAVWSSSHPNAVTDPQMVSPLRIAVASAARQVLQGVTESLILDDIDYKLGLWAMQPPSFWTKSDYNSDLGFVPAPPPSPPAPPMPPWPTGRSSSNSSPPGSGPNSEELPGGAGGDGGLSRRELALAIAIPSAVLLLLLLVMGLIVMRARAKAGYGMFSKVRAPGLGPATSLLVTDIQNSTMLWELLPAEVMDQAVQLHHQTFRGLLQEHKGYETCTEGDSFLIAFHTPWDALQYCQAVQVALLAAAWPQQLLEEPGAMEDAAEVQLICGSDATSWCEPRAFGRSGKQLPPPSALGGSARPWAWALALLRPGGAASPSPATRPIRHSGSSSINGSMKNSFGQRYVYRTSDSGYAADRMSGGEYQHSSDATTLQRSSSAGRLTAASGAGAGARAGTGSLDVARAAPASTPADLDGGRAGEGDAEQAWEGEGLPGQYSPAPQQQQPAGQQEQEEHKGETLETWLSSQVQCCSEEAPKPAACEAAPVVAFRGLRVRMGLHAGLVDPAEWCINQATGRMCASGPFLAMCKAVGDTASGGMVVLSRDFWTALLPFGTPPGCVVMHMGEHELRDQEGSTALYMALPRALVCRLALFPRLRTLGLTSPSLLTAPVGQATVVFMHAVGVGTLRAWDAQLTKEALTTYHQAVCSALLEWDGYLMELVDGLCLASFADPGAAVSWALMAQEDLLAQDWDPRLLRHEMCEEVAVMMHPSPHPLASASSFTRSASCTHVQLELRPAAADGTSPAPHPASIGAGGPVPGSQAHAVPVALPEPQVQRGRGGRAPLHSCVSWRAAGPTVKKKVLLRGLRIKAGIDTGEVHCSINPTTGRMAYMGKVMNRAARISGHATTSQILCSAQAWTSSCLSISASSSGCGPGHSRSPWGERQSPEVMGTSLGSFSLKGISQKVELVRCTLDEQ